MPRPRRDCQNHHSSSSSNNKTTNNNNNNNNSDPCEAVLCTVGPSCSVAEREGGSCFKSGFILVLVAVILFWLTVFGYQFGEQSQQMESDRLQTRRDMWELSRKQRALWESLEEMGRRMALLEERLRRFEDREMNLDVGGQVDYALGGRVLSVGGAESERNLTAMTSMVTAGECGCDGNTHPPHLILMPSHRPGDCWSVAIENAIATVELTDEIYVKAITLEHLHPSKSPSGRTSSAPKFFSMWGLRPPRKDVDCLGSFVYDNQGPAVQTFPVTDFSETAYRVVRLQVFTNHGHPEYTCVYRMRVHGVPVSAGASGNSVLQHKVDNKKG